MTLADGPRAELHVHLFASIPPAVMRELARRHRATLPAALADGIGADFRYRDWDHCAALLAALRPLATDVRVYRSLAGHPLRRLHESGVPITVNSDCPPMFGTTLNDEVAALSGPFGLDSDAVSEIIANGFRFAFDAGSAP